MYKTKMIAPCGINCSVCIAHLREKNRCAGCLSPDTDNIINHCKTCSIKYCPKKKGKLILCYKCKDFPCERIKHIDKRYRTKYNTSLINNLNEIKEIGIREFVSKDEKKWLCKKCHNVISIHKKACLNCGKEYITKSNF